MAKLRGDVDGAPMRLMKLGPVIGEPGAEPRIFELVDDKSEHWRLPVNRGEPLWLEPGQEIAVRCLEPSRECVWNGSRDVDAGALDFAILHAGLALSGLFGSLLLLERRALAWRNEKRLAAPPQT